MPANNPSQDIFAPMQIRRTFLFLILSLYCNYGHSQIQFSHQDSIWAKSHLSKMNLRQKIAQLFMIDFSAKVEQISQRKKTLELIKKYEVGGLIAMKGDYGLTSEWIHEFQKNSKTPLLISIDGEWGINMRISNTSKFPYALTLGALSHDSLIYLMGKAIGEDCRKLGIHINFAPVTDINNNPNNPVINYRSFGENKIKVANKSIKFALGQQSQLVMACAKHFPGHGDTDVDSHHDLPTIQKSRDQLENFELYPYYKLFEKSIWSTMVAHLRIPSIDPTSASSLSYNVVTDLLKNDMGFDGLIFTDALNMKAATKNNEAGEMELAAFQAGNDILLMSQNLESGIKKIEKHILSERFREIDLDQRVFKILLFKHKLRAFEPTEVATSPNDKRHDSLINRIYHHSMTLISQDKNEYEPIIDRTKKTVYISISDNSPRFSNYMQSFRNFSYIKINKNASLSEFNKIVEASREFEQVLISYHDLSQNSSSNFGLNSSIISFIKDINTHPNCLHFWFGSPYALKHFQEAKNIIICYEDNERTHKALFDKLYYAHTFIGELPVSVGKFKEGSNYLANRTIDPLPHSVDTSDIRSLNKEEILKRIEQLCQEIRSEGAAPGGQIYVLHKGKTIYNKAFGRHTYSSLSNEVKHQDLYDLASVSKIIGTTLATMKLVESGKIKLTDRVSDILSLDDSNTVSDITIQQLMTHEAGLTPYIPFYERFNDSNFFAYFRLKSEAGYTTKVAKDLYIKNDYKDSMWHETIHSTRRGIGDYKYSDLSMYLMQRIIEVASGKSLDNYLFTNFYRPMGLNLCYNPTEKYPIDNIVPSEFDTKFRLQQVQGYVHDQGCALYGGVCGHAGLFGNAQDVAQIMQMLLNGGKYKGKQYIKPEIISQFTQQQSPTSRRGLGFDKPNVDNLSSTPTAAECSFATFGHTGFTGTCAWADPFNELVYVFLSNRVYPDAGNKKLARNKYRERIQSLFYHYTR